MEYIQWDSLKLDTTEIYRRIGLPDAISDNRGGLQTGYNLCPGGYQIPLEAQKILFALLDGGKLGITLGESLLMAPVKSHTLVVPVGEKLSKANLSCAITGEMCVEQQNCAHSRLKFGKATPAAM